MVYFEHLCEKIPLMFSYQEKTASQEFNPCFISMQMINNSVFLYNGGYKFQLILILPDEFNEKNDFWLNGIWNNYKYFTT